MDISNACELAFSFDLFGSDEKVQSGVMTISSFSSHSFISISPTGRSCSRKNTPITDAGGRPATLREFERRDRKQSASQARHTSRQDKCQNSHRQRIAASR
eukprot:Selendium_serpulae@DN5849_c1_g2_i1.p1